MNGHNEWLPIGSVVLMDGGSRAVTITGCMLREESGELSGLSASRILKGGPVLVRSWFSTAGTSPVLLRWAYTDPDGDRFLAELDAHDEEWRQHRADAAAAHGSVDTDRGADV